MRPEAVRDRDRRRTARAGARGDHRDRRRVSQARARRTCRDFEGAGVYYGATFIEAQLCSGEEVIVVGGGNSAGQAAVFLAQTRERVHMLVRSERPGRDHVALPDPAHRGEPEHRRCARTRRSSRSRATTTSSACAGGTTRTGDVETHDIRHVFVMTGAVPNTQWLDGCVALDAKGFIKTGPDLSPDDLAGRALAARPAALPARDEPARACSPSATSAAATSSAWRPRSAKDRSAFSSSTEPCRSRVNPRGFAPRTPRHALSRAASTARSDRVARSHGSLASWGERQVYETASSLIRGASPLELPL